MRMTVLLFATMLLFACNEQTTDVEAEKERLMQLSREWAQVAASNDIDTILSYWADDAVVMAPGSQTLKGKDAIRQMLVESTQIPNFKITWEPISATVSKSGDMAYLIERNQISFTDSLGNPVTTHNKVVTVWQKNAEGNWKAVVDTWNAEPMPN